MRLQSATFALLFILAAINGVTLSGSFQLNESAADTGMQSVPPTPVTQAKARTSLSGNESTVQFLDLPADSNLQFIRLETEANIFLLELFHSTGSLFVAKQADSVFGFQDVAIKRGPLSFYVFSTLPFLVTFGFSALEGETEIVMDEHVVAYGRPLDSIHQSIGGISAERGLTHLGANMSVGAGVAAFLVRVEGQNALHFSEEFRWSVNGTVVSCFHDTGISLAPHYSAVAVLPMNPAGESELDYYNAGVGFSEISAYGVWIETVNNQYPAGSSNSQLREKLNEPEVGCVSVFSQGAISSLARNF
jgi:hypothetical protein